MSAHDSDMSMTTDFHIDEMGRPVKHLNDDVWYVYIIID